MAIVAALMALIDSAHTIAFYTRYLYQTIHRIAGHFKVMFHCNFCSDGTLIWRPPNNSVSPAAAIADDTPISA